MAQHALHRDNLVTAAMRLFRRQGYASTGLQQILSESGAPKGSLYHYFPRGKEALAEAAIERAGDLMAEMLSEARTLHGNNPKAFVKRYATTLARWMSESQYCSGCPIATTLLETAPQSPELTAAGEKVFAEWTRIIAGVLKDSGLRPQAAREKAQLLIASMEGALILSRVKRSEKPILDVARYFEP